MKSLTFYVRVLYTLATQGLWFRTSSIHLTWELVRNVNSQFLPKPCSVWICIKSIKFWRWFRYTLRFGNVSSRGLLWELKVIDRKCPWNHRYSTNPLWYHFSFWSSRRWWFGRAHKCKISVTNCLVLPFLWVLCPVLLSFPASQHILPYPFFLKAHHNGFLLPIYQKVVVVLPTNTSGCNQEIGVWLLAWLLSVTLG